MKKVFPLVLFSFLLCYPVYVQAEDSAAQTVENNFVISDFKSNIVLSKDGTSAVTEDITADFGENPHHGIYRTLPAYYKSLIFGKRGAGITASSVKWGQPGETLKEAPYTIETALGGDKLKIGDPNNTVTGQMVFEINYVAGPAHKASKEYDQFLWEVTGTAWTVPIQEASFTLTGPIDFNNPQCFAPTGTQKNCTISGQGTKITASAENLSPHEGLTAGGQLPPGTLSKPNYASKIFPQIILPLLIPVIVLYLILRKRALIQKHINAKTIVPEFSAPNLEPALADAFFDGDIKGEPIPAALIDMAARGELTITEEKGFLGHRNFIFELKNMPVDPNRPLVMYLSHLLFSLTDKQSIDDICKNRGLSMQLISQPQKVGWDYLKKLGYFSAADDTNLNNIIMYIMGFILLLTMFGLGFLMLIGNISIFWPLAALVPAITCLSVKWLFKGGKLTDKGIEMRSQVMGFHLFMHTAERYRQQWQEKQGELDKYLAWAMVFGITKEWLKKLSEIGVVFTPPVWYVGTHPFDSHTFANEFSNSMNSLAVASTSTGTSSGGVGSGGGSGGGGGW